MKITMDNAEAYAKNFIYEPKGKTRIVFWALTAVSSLIGFWIFGSAVISARWLSAVLAVPLFFILSALPLAFYHFFKGMIDGIGSREAHEAAISAQVSGYLTLPFRKTYRGMAFYITFYVLFVTAMIGLLTQNIYMLYETALIVPILYWMKKGSRGVFLFAFVWWTMEKALQFYGEPLGAISFSVILWLVLVDYIYWQAYVVEIRVAKAAEENPELRKPVWRQFFTGLGIFVVMLLLIQFLANTQSF